MLCSRAELLHIASLMAFHFPSLALQWSPVGESLLNISPADARLGMFAMLVCAEALAGHGLVHRALLPANDVWRPTQLPGHKQWPFITSLELVCRANLEVCPACGVGTGHVL